MWTCGWIHKAHTGRGLYFCTYICMVLCGVCILRSLELSHVQEFAQMYGSGCIEMLVHLKKASTDTDSLQGRLKQLQASHWLYPFGNLGFPALVCQPHCAPSPEKASV